MKRFFYYFIIGFCLIFWYNGFKVANCEEPQVENHSINLIYQLKNKGTLTCSMADTFITYNYHKAYVINSVELDGVDYPIHGDLIMNDVPLINHSPVLTVPSVEDLNLNEGWRMYSENNVDFCSTKIELSEDKFHIVNQIVGGE